MRRLHAFSLRPSPQLCRLAAKVTKQRCATVSASASSREPSSVALSPAASFAQPAVRVRLVQSLEAGQPLLGVARARMAGYRKRQGWWEDTAGPSEKGLKEGGGGEAQAARGGCMGAGWRGTKIVDSAAGQKASCPGCGDRATTEQCHAEHCALECRTSRACLIAYVRCVPIPLRCGASPAALPNRGGARQARHQLGLAACATGGAATLRWRGVEQPRLVCG